MSENRNEGSGQRTHRWSLLVWGAAAFLLLIPFLGMQFSEQVNWDMADFAIFGGLLAGVCLLFELAVRRTGNAAYRAAVTVALVTTFILIWVNAAVGIIGNENNSANLMYGGVIAVGVIGVLVARFQPLGMARALVATAVAQIVVLIIALIAGFATLGLDILILTGFFTTLWLLSAWLFWQARDK